MDETLETNVYIPDMGMQHLIGTSIGHVQLYIEHTKSRCNQHYNRSLCTLLSLDRTDLQEEFELRGLNTRKQVELYSVQCTCTDL